jgi:carboxylesterase
VIEGAEAWSAVGEGATGTVGVLVSHGFTGNPVSTRPLGERLHADGFTVEVVRLPGHGTTPQDMSTTRYADWLAAVEAAVDDLADRCDHVVLVGLSMGGTLCLDVAARRDVAGVVAINALVLEPQGLIVKLAPILQHIAPMVPAKLAGIAENDMKRTGVSEKAYDTVPAKAGHSLTRALARVRAQLRQLTAPVLVVWSREDHTVDPANSATLLDVLPGPDVRQLELTNSYHVATLDLDQDLLFDTISAFVGEVTGTA